MYEINRMFLLRVAVRRPLVAGYRIAQTPPSPFHVGRQDVGHKKALSVMIDS